MFLKVNSPSAFILPNSSIAYYIKRNTMRFVRVSIMKYNFLIGIQLYIIILTE